MKIGKIVKKLNVTDNTIILVKSGSALGQYENVDQLSKALTAMGLLNVLVCIVDDFDDLAMLDEKEMQALGWVKANERARRYSVVVKEQEEVESEHNS